MIHQQVMQSMKEMAAKFATMGVELALPPPSSLALGTYYTAIDPGKSLTARFRFNQQFTNPVKMFQGGMICAAFDEVFGPLTYMVSGRPATTLEMSTTYVRPFTEKDDAITIHAELVSQSKSLIFLRGEAKTEAGKLVASATTHSLVMSDENILRYKK